MTKAKRIHFYANPHDQAVLARIQARNPHWTTAFTIREALYALDKQQHLAEDTHEAEYQQKSAIRVIRQ